MQTHNHDFANGGGGVRLKMFSAQECLSSKRHVGFVLYVHYIYLMCFDYSTISRAPRTGDGSLRMAAEVPKAMGICPQPFDNFCYSFAGIGDIMYVFRTTKRSKLRRPDNLSIKTKLLSPSDPSLITTQIQNTEAGKLMQNVRFVNH